MQERYSYGWDDEESKKLKKLIMAEREKTHVRYYGGKIMKQESRKVVRSEMIVRREEIKKVREANERNNNSHGWKKMVMTEWQEKKTRKNKMVMLEIIVGKKQNEREADSHSWMCRRES